MKIDEKINFKGGLIKIPEDQKSTGAFPQTKQIRYFLPDIR